MIEFNLLDDNEIAFELDNDNDVEINEIDSINYINVNDYEKLRNLPRLNGQVIIGNMKEIDPTVPAWAKEQNKPSYDANEVGAVGINDTMSLLEIDDMFKQVFGGNS